jgi:exodeoxyribonuclease VII small subunit
VPPNSPEEQQTQHPTFEQVLDQLEKIVHDLEDGGMGLNEALTAYEKGVRLLRQCHLLLEKVERRIELLSGVDANGNAITQPLDDTALSLEEKARRGRRRSSPKASQLPATPESGDLRDDPDVPGGLF